MVMVGSHQTERGGGQKPTRRVEDSIYPVSSIAISKLEFFLALSGSKLVGNDEQAAERSGPDMSSLAWRFESCRLPR